MVDGKTTKERESFTGYCVRSASFSVLPCPVSGSGQCSRSSAWLKLRCILAPERYQTDEAEGILALVGEAVLFVGRYIDNIIGF